MGLPSTLVVARRLGELPSFGLGLDYSSAAVVLRNGTLVERRREARLALEPYQPLGAHEAFRLVHEVGRALVLVAVVRDCEAAGELHLCSGLVCRLEGCPRRARGCLRGSSAYGTTPLGSRCADGVRAGFAALL